MGLRQLFLNGVISTDAELFLRRLRTRLRRKALSAGEKFERSARRYLTIRLNRLANARAKVGQLRAKHGARIAAVVIIALIATTPLLVKSLQPTIEPVFTPERLASFRSLLLALGGALLGATAIGFSVVMLAVQVNFARIPHALFRKLSQDFDLLGAFAATFLLATVIALLSMIPDASWVGLAIAVASWSAVLTLVLFLHAYRRALDLINPTSQLRLVLTDVEKVMRQWDRWATRSAPLLGDKSDRLEKRDMRRAIFFKANPNWHFAARQGVAHAVSFARRYAEQGEYEVSLEALATIAAINAAYCSTRGKTFFPYSPLFENPLAAEGFISDTLEDLRKLSVVALSRGDEEQTTQIMGSFSNLVMVYSKIDYGQNLGASLHHSQLATSYLIGVVEAAAVRLPADPMMEGIRLIGRCGIVVLLFGASVAIVTVAQKLAALSQQGLVKPNFGPVVQTGVKELASLTFQLLISKEEDVGYPLKELRKAIGTVAQAVVVFPDTPLSSAHSGHMSPYYSLARSDTFGERLTDLVNAITEADAQDEDAARVLRHIEKWSEGLYHSAKDLLLSAVKQRSGLTFDIVHWIAFVTQLLVVASNSPSASKHVASQLTRNASWLISVFSWLPAEKDVVTFVENFQVSEQLFEAAFDARIRGNEEVAQAGRDLLIDWAFKSGRHQTGWSIFETALTGLVALVAWKGRSDWAPWLNEQLVKRLAEDRNFAPEQRANAAKALRKLKMAGDTTDLEFSAIQRAIGRIDRPRLRAVVTDVIRLLEDEPGDP